MAEYLGVTVNIATNDREHLGYLQAAGRGQFVVQRCDDCDRLRYPPGPACPFCQSLDSQWAELSGRGTIYSYEIVMHPIHPAYRERAPYPVVLVELEEQRGVPGEHDALRVVSSLVDAEGRPESEERVAIGTPVEVEFADLGDGLALPRFRISDRSPADELWRFPG